MATRTDSRADILDSLFSASDSKDANAELTDASNAARPGKFRFKPSSSSAKRERDNKDTHTHRHFHYHRSKRRRHSTTAPTASIDDPSLYDDTYLPNIRSAAYASPQEDSLDPDRAFQESLFDAIADDEGAAYWEGVYSQPIHVYPREYRSPETGTLERMTDEEYAEYVKLKMWEKKNPHLVRARREAERKEKERAAEREKAREAEQRRRRKMEQMNENENFWERLKGEDERWRSGRRKRRGFSTNSTESSDDEYTPTTKSQRQRLRKSGSGKGSSRWGWAWKRYLDAWNMLPTDTAGSNDPVHTRIPWPTQGGVFNTVDEISVKDFYQHATAAVKNAPEVLARGSLFKSERFRWHPDKIRHKFGGDKVDDETMKVVNMVSQTINALLEEEKGKS